MNKLYITKTDDLMSTNSSICCLHEAKGCCQITMSPAAALGQYSPYSNLSYLQTLCKYYCPSFSYRSPNPSKHQSIGALHHSYSQVQTFYTKLAPGPKICAFPTESDHLQQFSNHFLIFGVCLYYCLYFYLSLLYKGALSCLNYGSIVCLFTLR